MSAEAPEGAVEKRSRHRSISTTEYRSGQITVRVPSELPPLTPRVARALLAILRKLTDEEFRKRSKDTDS